MRRPPLEPWLPLFLRSWPPRCPAALAQGARCTARYAPAPALEDLGWQDLCRGLRDPRLITHAWARAQMGAWVPQALPARRHTLRDVLAQLARHPARLRDLSLAEVLAREEFARRRKAVAQPQQGLRPPRRPRDAQAQPPVNVAALAQGLETFCQRRQPTRDPLPLAQRRPLVAFLIDCVIVHDTQGEIRSVGPTGPKGATTPFCHVRLDSLDAETLLIPATRLLGGRQMADQLQGLLLPLRPTTPHHDGALHLAGARDLLERTQPPRLETRA